MVTRTDCRTSLCLIKATEPLLEGGRTLGYTEGEETEVQSENHFS